MMERREEKTGKGKKCELTKGSFLGSLFSNNLLADYFEDAVLRCGWLGNLYLRK